MKQSVRKNRLEWSVFSVSLILILALLGYLIHDALTSGDAPPDIVVSLGTPRSASGGHAVPVTVLNRGDMTAEGVHIVVTLNQGSGEEEQAELDIPFVPRRATREGWVTFQTDPRGGTLHGRAVGYEMP